MKEAAWTISNITAGTAEQIQKVIDAHILKDLIDVLRRVSLLVLGLFSFILTFLSHLLWLVRRVTSRRKEKQFGQSQILRVAAPLCNYSCF